MNMVSSFNEPDETLLSALKEALVGLGKKSNEIVMRYVPIVVEAVQVEALE